jgi:nitronate monooxygenase
MVREPPALIRSEVAQVRARTDRRFGVNLIPAATDPTLLEAELATCLELGVPVMALFWDLSAEVVRRLTGEGILVVCQVGSAREAVEAQHAGAGALIAQGWEAGGHVRGVTGLTNLLPEVVTSVDLPVLAAGGIVDGKGVAAALLLGAQGAVLGTAFLATRESFAHDYHKQRIVQAGPDETLHTQSFHINWPGGAAVRVLPNSVTRGERGDPNSGKKVVIGEEEGRPIYLFSTDSPLRSMTGDFEAMALYAGQGAWRIGSIQPAGEKLKAIVQETVAVLAGEQLRSSPAAETNEPSSPACLASRADDAYMGYANREELLAFLNELLEAERAGARVAVGTWATEVNGEIAQLARAIQRDEAHWCAVLTKVIRSLEAQPSKRVGAFYEKAMAIPDAVERLRFLNRGQGWVVRKLREFLPKVRDDRIYADLLEMSLRHEGNIEVVNAAVARLTASPPNGPPPSAA